MSDAVHAQLGKTHDALKTTPTNATSRWSRLKALREAGLPPAPPPG